MRKKSKADKLEPVRTAADDLLRSLEIASGCTLKMMRRAAGEDEPVVTEQQTRAMKNVVSAAKDAAALVRSVYDMPDEKAAESTSTVVILGGEELAR